MKLALVAYGALGRYMEGTVAETLSVDRSQTIYFDDNCHKAGMERSRPFAAHTDDEFADYSFFVCLGYKHLKIKRELIERLVGLGREVPSFVHPSSYVHPTTKLGHGAYIYPGVNIDRECVVGNGTWLANGDIVAHNCTIGAACWFGASVTLSGEVSVGDYTFIGSGSTTANVLSIGSNVIIGVGTAVTKPVPDNASVIGNPMRILERPLKLV